MFLDAQINKCKQAASPGFPDMMDLMDLMVGCLEAGLSLDASVQRAGGGAGAAPPDHLRPYAHVVAELRAGWARKTAWRAFASRLALEEAGSLATMLRQA